MHVPPRRCPINPRSLIQVSPLYGHNFGGVHVPEGIWVLPYGTSESVYKQYMDHDYNC